MGSSREMWQVGRTWSGPVMGQWENFMITAVSYKLTSEIREGSENH